MYDRRINRIRARLNDVEARLPRQNQDEETKRALVRRIQQDPDLRKAALRWFAAEARQEPQAKQFLEELARLMYLS